jgi:glutathione synthase/RimK-type ligase-like ATP-grasp enzyme
MRRVAYLTGRSFHGEITQPGATPTYDQGDFELVRAAGQRVGLWLEPCFWDDVTLAARGFDAALVRSCWDYTSQADRFLDHLDAHEAAGLPVFNTPALVRWNARKAYLRALEQAGVPVIETIWVEALDARRLARAFDDLDAAELVVKPQVGASSEATLRLKRNAWSAADLVLGPQGPAMIQPYLPAIETEGELSLVYFGGTLAHVIRKRPRAGRWFANDLDARFSVVAPPAGVIETAEMALAATPAPPLLARIDLVRAPAGDWRLIELELIEPYFFLVFAPPGADALARALLRALDGAEVLPPKRQRSARAHAGQSGRRA